MIEDEYPQWKQGINLSDEEESNEIILSETEEHQPQIKSSEGIIQKASGDEISELMFLSYPGGLMFFREDVSLENIFFRFISKNVMESIKETLNHILLKKMQHQDNAAFQSKFLKVQIQDREISIFLGMQLLLGVYRFAHLELYWNSDPLLRGGIETFMLEGRYKFMDTYLMIAKPDDIKLRWRKFNRPDQELLLICKTFATHKIYYLMDSDTLYILDEIIDTNTSTKKDLNTPVQGQVSIIEQLLRMLMPFSGKNHILYVQQGIFSSTEVISLAEQQIYCVAELEYDGIIPDDGTLYETKRLFLSVRNYQLFIYPKCKLDGEVVSQEQYLENQQDYFQRASRRLENVELYRNPFCHTSVILNSYLRDPDAVNRPIPNFRKMMLEEYIEITLYNIYTLFSRSSSKGYKQFKLQMASSLIGDKYLGLEKDRKEVLRRQNLKIKSTEIQTDPVGFGLPETFEHDFHFPMEVPQTQQMKYCIVCMKYDQVSKPHYECLQCKRQFNQKIFLCVQPCFELYHRHPNNYLKFDERLLEPQTDPKYMRPPTLETDYLLEAEYFFVPVVEEPVTVPRIVLNQQRAKANQSKLPFKPKAPINLEYNPEDDDLEFLPQPKKKKGPSKKDQVKKKQNKKGMAKLEEDEEPLFDYDDEFDEELDEEELEELEKMREKKPRAAKERKEKKEPQEYKEQREPKDQFTSRFEGYMNNI